MYGHTQTFLLVTILALVTILLIFAMKYFALARQSHRQVAGDAAYKELAQRAASAQAECLSQTTAIHTEIAEIKDRLGSVEKLLREVG